MRYYSFSTYCKNTFNHRLYKVAIDAGFTCPNRDGTIDNRGCIFCSERGSGDFTIPFTEDINSDDFIYNHEEGDGKYIAYFQSYSNTYGSIEKLRKIYEKALDSDLFRGIDIATRADCINDEVIELLKELKDKYKDKFIWVELGLQTVNEANVRWMRRGYELPVFDEAILKLNEIGIPIIAHIILGLPNEKEEAVLKTIDYINKHKIDGIKIHLLHYLRNTDLGNEYLKDNNKYHPLEEDEYINLVVLCIANLREDIVIHRLTGDGKKDDLIAPLWSLNKKHVLNRINHELKVRDIRQGCAL